MQHEQSDIGHSCKSESAENTLHCSSPLFSSSNLYSPPSQPLELLAHKRATATGCSWMRRCSMHLQQSRHLSKQQRHHEPKEESNGGVTIHEQGWVAFIKQTERGAQGLLRKRQHAIRGNVISLPLRKRGTGPRSGRWSAHCEEICLFILMKKSCKAEC